MKVIVVNGSPRPKGNTYQALQLCIKTLNEAGIETELLQLGTQVHGCTGCGHCFRNEEHRCIFSDDILNEYSEKIRQADGLIVGSPVYYAGIAGTLKCFLDRLFYTSSSYMALKPAAGIAVARRAGTVATYDQINHYFALGEMFVVPSTYWNDGYGGKPGEIQEDAEGLNHMVTIAKNMAWLLHALEAGKKVVPLPPRTEKIRTNFIR